MPLTPNNREEHWLQGMVDGSTTLTPNKRQEYWYQEIINAPGGGGGGGNSYDVVILINESESTMTVLSGDYSATETKVKAGTPCTGMIFHLQNGEGEYFQSNEPILGFYTYDGENQIELQFGNSMAYTLYWDANGVHGE